MSITPQVTVIAPGFVHIKGALDEAAQRQLCTFAAKFDFWTTLPNGERVLNSGTERGRIYDAIHKFPESDMIKQKCLGFVSLAQKYDSKMPSTNPTHLLLLYYAGESGMYWHRDSDKNDGDTDHPVVSLSLGDACDFGYKLIGKQPQYLRIESGDVVLFGGPQRMLEHCVHKVYSGTCPDFLPMAKGRFNFTFRDVPNILGQEEKYQSFVEVENEKYKDLVTALATSLQS